jgi:hypothetical protein
MAGRGPQSFKKRQKEQQRKEKQQEKLAKRLERRRQGSQPGEEGGAAEPEMETPIRESEQSYQATNTDKVLS